MIGSTVRRSLLVLLLLPLAGCGSMMLAFGGGMTPELRANGVPAPAEILAIWDTGMTINDDPVIGMRVRVVPPDRPDFEATIDKTTVSRIALAQFQPGNVVPVRFDPNDPRVVAVDPDPPSEPDAASASGNPYHDRYEPAPKGNEFLAPPEEPAVYLGTGDSAADAQALYENEYALLGRAAVHGDADLAQALEQGREAGAALVVVYGPFASSGEALEVLPYRRSPQGAVADAWAKGLFSNLGADDRVATYWGKTSPAMLGVIYSPYSDRQRAAESGLVVDAVVHGSPAAEAGIAAGDVLVAIEGQPVAADGGIQPILRAHAGGPVLIELLRDGNRMAVTVQLPSASL